MKNFILLLTILFSSFMALDASAQMSRKEAKAWKKRLKRVTPQQYKSLLDESKSSKNQINALKAELKSAEAKASEKDEQVSTYKSQLKDLRNELAKAKQAARAKPKETGRTINEKKGIIFKVQIGAFKNKDMSSFKDNSRNFGSESADDMNKFTIGVFRDYLQADRFKKELRSMGVRKAWVVSYRDGQRVPIGDVMDGIKK